MKQYWKLSVVNSGGINRADRLNILEKKAGWLMSGYPVIGLNFSGVLVFRVGQFNYIKFNFN